MGAEAWIHEELSAFPAAVKDFQFMWNWYRWFVGDKMFAAISLNRSGEEVFLNLKLEPLEGDFLRQQYEDIIPGYHMNKVHWNSVKLDGNVPDDVIRHMMAESYRLVAKSLTKKARIQLGIEGKSCLS